MATAERRTDFGPPNYERFLPPVIKANYGKWKYHEVLKPGVMVQKCRSSSSRIPPGRTSKADSPSRDATENDCVPTAVRNIANIRPSGHTTG